LTLGRLTDSRAKAHKYCIEYRMIA